MALPLFAYRPTTQNNRVRDFGVNHLNESARDVHRLLSNSDADEIDAIIWSAYRQVFSENEILQFNRDKSLESLLRDRAISVRDFIRGLAKSPRFYELVVSTNNCYRLVHVCFVRLLGRQPFNQDEEIAWSVKTSTLGFHGFVDALLDSEEYLRNFGDDIVPYQRRRQDPRPAALATPRYGREYYERKLGWTGKPDWRFIMAKRYHAQDHHSAPSEGDPRRFKEMVAQLDHHKGNGNGRVSTVKGGPFDVDYYLRKLLG
ncbi:phycobilisome rod-core linker polypeptide [Nodosilinea nodulosa]|uniref:phycobilisome rod-core linker polypeptide n=1 Tax=Nodosilinea nodulosa TaxID=416001 RepID=UPI000312CD2E|nr:phycobilisome rod-core linker polypeptide [Nodosilinea nodulosa]